MTVQAGSTYTFTADYYNEPGPSGVLTDPTGSVQVTITYGTTGAVVAGPFTYAGGSVPSASAVYRQSTGIYVYQWLIPQSAQSGVYVANWQFVDGPESTAYFGEENLTVTGIGVTPPANGDTGYWSGALTYGAVSVPLGSTDATGTAWALLRVDGMDGVPTAGQVVQRAGDHGGYAMPQFYGPRPITLTVRATASSQALRDTARALMQQAVPVGDLGTFVYNEPVPKTLQVRRSGRLIEKCPTLTDVEFTVGLVAPDPRKYGTATHQQSAIAPGPAPGLAPPLTPPILLPATPPPPTINAVNGGNFETRPMVTITGPITGPVIYNQSTGQAVSYSTLTLAAGDQLSVDFLNRIAYLNGSAFRAADPTSSWWVLAPGTTQVALLGTNDAGATLTLTYQDAWM